MGGSQHDQKRRKIRWGPARGKIGADTVKKKPCWKGKIVTIVNPPYGWEPKKRQKKMELSCNPWGGIKRAN